MTVNKTATTTAKTKKKTTASSSTTQATTSSSSTSTKKVIGSSSTSSQHQTHEQIQDGALSKSSSASSLRISDISHLPVNTQLVSYTVTETLPQGGGEKITKYEESGATSTEYRHFIAQDQASKVSSDITQISSVLNQSTSNLSESSAATNETYIVHEPKEELRIVNKNDSAWNGKFIYEQPVKSNQIVEQSSQSTSSQKRSYNQKSSSDSYVIEIVDGKERIVDRKHHESQFADSASNQEQLVTKSGTNIKPEIHYSQKVKESSLAYDTDSPDLKIPKTRSLEAGKKIHKIGDSQTSSSYKTEDNAITDGRILQSIKTDTDLDDTFALENLNSTNIDRRRQTITDSSKIDSSKSTQSKISSQSITDSKVSKTSKSQISKSENIYVENIEPLEGDIDTVISTTTTYYDSKGNVVKVDTDVQKSDVEQVPVLTEPGVTTTIKTTTTVYDSKGNVINENVDIDTMHLDNVNSKIMSDSKSITEEDIKSSTRVTEDVRNISTLDQTATMIDETDIKTSTLRDSRKSDRITDTNKFHSTTDSNVNQINTEDIRYVDENYVDTTKIRNSQTITDSRNFYGHSIDSKDTVVGNTYDTTAVQNVIGTKGKVIKDNTLDSTDVIYSNDRLYGKTGWNGQFIYETPAKPKDTSTPKKGPKDRKPRKPGEQGIEIVEYITISTPEGPKRVPRYSNQTVEEVISEFDTTHEKIQKAMKDVKVTSGTFIDNESTVEYIIVDGKRLPKRPDDKSRAITEVTEYVVVDDKKITKEPIVRPRPTTKTIEYIVVNGKRVLKTPIDKPKKEAPDAVEYVIIGGKLQPKTPSNKPKQPENIEVIEYITIDGVRRPLRPEDTSKYPLGDSKTTIETYESVTNLQDSKTTITKDSQTFVDDQTTVEHYTTSDVYDSNKDVPMDLKRPQKPFTDRPKDEYVIVDGKRVPREPKDRPRPTTKTIEYIVVNGKRVLKTPTDKPRKDASDAVEYVIIGGKLQPKKPLDRPTQPERTEIIEYITVDGVRRPLRPEDTSKYPLVDSKTTIETYESVTNLQDSKTTLIKDSQTFVDDQRLVEHYTTSNVYDSTKDGREDIGYPRKPIEESPNDNKKDSPRPKDEYVIIDGKRVPKEPKERAKPTTKTIEYIVVNGKRVLKTPIDKSKKDAPDTVEYVIIGGKLQPRKPSDKPKQPERTEIIEYITVDGVRRPLRPEDTSKYPLVDSKATIETYERVTNLQDSKTSIIKDSQTFIDDKRTVEHYTTVDVYASNKDEPKALGGPKKTIGESPKYDRKDSPRPKGEYVIIDGKRVPKEPKERAKPTTKTIEYIVVNGRRVLKTPIDKPKKDAPDAVEYVIIGGKLQPRKPSDKPTRPERTEIIEYVIIGGKLQ
ncbi:hypothetical protein AMK59_7874, partial [Oryctes borbonicus]